MGAQQALVLCALCGLFSFAAAFLPSIPAPLTAHTHAVRLQAATSAQEGNLVKAPAQDLAVSLPPIPKLITFDAEGTLLQLTSPRGLLLRECLLKAHGYTVRLPGPDVFQVRKKASGCSNLYTSLFCIACIYK
jgi:hypothetical protein